MILAVAFIAALVFSLSTILSEPEPVYRPQIVLFAREVETTCGGMISCPLAKPILRKPIPPASFKVQPLGLALPKARDFAIPPSDKCPYWELDAGTWY